MDAVTFLESWFSSQCNGDWEHQHCIKIDTPDNPGWRLEIDLRDTSAESRTLERMKIERAEHDWVQYWVEKNKFQARSGPRNLTEAITIFKNWFENPT